jgi:hypothetical protein
MVCRDYRYPDLKTLFRTKDVSITTHGSVRETRELRDIASLIDRSVSGTSDPENTRSIKPGRSNQRKMSELDNVIGLSDLYDEYITILQHHYLPEQELVLCKCETAIVFLSLNGAITDSIPLDQAEI